MSKRFFEGAKHSLQYSLFRPRPPLSLIEEIVEKVPEKKLAVDVGCGTGQSTRILSPFFRRVLGLDVSQAQIENARKESVDNVEFQVGFGEALPNKDQSVDLVTACQSVHWLDFDKFYSEVDRVLKPRGVLAIYGYHLTGVSPDHPSALTINRLRDQVFTDVTGKYWPPERKLVDEGYTTLPYAYPNVIRSDRHFTQVESDLQNLANYIQTWSGFQKFKSVQGDGQAEDIIQDFIQK